MAEFRRRLGSVMGLLEAGTPEAAARARHHVNEWGATRLTEPVNAGSPRQRIMDAAHQTCPYSKALRGDAAVTLVVD